MTETLASPFTPRPTPTGWRRPRTSPPTSPPGPPPMTRPATCPSRTSRRWPPPGSTPPCCHERSGVPTSPTAPRRDPRRRHARLPVDGLHLVDACRRGHHPHLARRAGDGRVLRRRAGGGQALRQRPVGADLRQPVPDAAPARRRHRRRLDAVGCEAVRVGLRDRRPPPRDCARRRHPELLRRCPRPVHLVRPDLGHHGHAGHPQPAHLVRGHPAAGRPPLPAARSLPRTRSAPAWRGCRSVSPRRRWRR